MKGLLLKDFYMLKKYYRTYLLIVVVFTAASLVGDDNMFFTFYPVLLCGMIPVSLLGYDERSRWIEYSGTLPYTKAQIVSSKYIIGLSAQIIVLLVTGIAQGIKMSKNGGLFANNYFLALMLGIFIMAAFSSFCLPFIFKFGMEKGRMAYYVMIGFICAGGWGASKLLKGGLKIGTQVNAVLLMLALAGIGIYVLSWYLSIVFYKRREI